MSAGTIYNWENNIKKPYELQLEKVAQVLNTSSHFLLIGEKRRNSLSLGEKIKEARLKKKLTQKELAFKIGVTRGTIQDWENNRTLPNKDNLKMLKKMLELTF